MNVISKIYYGKHQKVKIHHDFAHNTVGHMDNCTVAIHVSIVYIEPYFGP